MQNEQLDHPVSIEESSEKQKTEEETNAALQKLLVESTKYDRSRRAPSLRQIWQRLNPTPNSTAPSKLVREEQ
jgi:hypothetical protein